MNKISLIERILYYLFLLLLPASIVRVNAAIPGLESFFLFRVLLLLIAVISFFGILLKRDFLLKRLKELREEKLIFGFFALWLIVSLVSYFWVLDVESYIRYNVLLAISIFFLFALVFFISSRKTLNVVWRILLITLGVAIFVALLEIFFGLRLPGSKLISASRSYNLFVTSFFNHPNDFASYISLTLPFLTLLPLLKSYERYKWGVFFSVLLVVFVLTFTGSKINYAATIVGLVAAVLILRKEKIKQVLAFLAIFVVAFFSVLPATGPDIAIRIMKFTNRTVDLASYKSIRDGVKLEGVVRELVEGYGSATTRKNLMLNSFRIVKENPKLYVGFFTGVGAGQVEEYMARFQSTKGVTSLHNWWLEVLVNHGIFIGLGYGVLFLWLLREVYNKAQRTKDEFLRYINYSLVVILVVFVLTSVSPSSSVGYAPLWLTLGLAFAAKNLR